MPDVIDRDALAFAAVRAAHFESPQRQTTATGVNATQQFARELELTRAQIAESPPWPALIDSRLLCGL
jgi:hypothetical protein